MIDERYTKALAQEIGEPTGLLDEVLIHMLILAVLFGKIKDTKISKVLSGLLFGIFTVFQKYYISFSFEHKHRYYLSPNGAIRENMGYPLSRLFSYGSSTKLIKLPKFKIRYRRIEDKNR